MSPARPLHLPYPASFPRVSGDEPAAEADTRIERVFSPRERG